MPHPGLGGAADRTPVTWNSRSLSASRRHERADRPRRTQPRAASELLPVKITRASKHQRGMTGAARAWLSTHTYYTHYIYAYVYVHMCEQLELH